MGTLWKKMLFNVQVQIVNLGKKFDKKTTVSNPTKDDIQMQVTAVKQDLQLDGVEFNFWWQT